MDKKTLIHLSNLGKINFTDEELERFGNDMSEIINLMDKIKEIDISYDDTKDNNAVSFKDLREDVAKESLSVDELLKNAEHMDDCFIVPKVVD